MRIQYRRHQPSYRPLVIFTCIGLSVLIFLFGRHKSTQSSILSPLPDAATTTIETTTKTSKNAGTSTKKIEDLKSEIKSMAEKKWNNYSILVSDLTTNFVMELNESSIYDAASVNKIPILATLYHEASAGNIDFSKTITMQAKDIQDYGTGSMRYDPPGTVYSIKTLANLMVKKSDNTAAYILANYILSLKQIQSYMEQLGLTQTDLEKNTTSNADMATLFRAIYKGNVSTKALNPEMLGLMKDTDFEDRLPGKLPSGAVVYHKIGTGEGGAVHDVGIVQTKKTAYYIGVFTSGVLDETQAGLDIADISKAVYDFMNR